MATSAQLLAQANAAATALATAQSASKAAADKYRALEAQVLAAQNASTSGTNKYGMTYAQWEQYQNGIMGGSVYYSPEYWRYVQTGNGDAPDMGSPVRGGFKDVDPSLVSSRDAALVALNAYTSQITAAETASRNAKSAYDVAVVAEDRAKNGGVVSSGKSGASSTNNGQISTNAALKNQATVVTDKSGTKVATPTAGTTAKQSVAANQVKTSATTTAAKTSTAGQAATKAQTSSGSTAKASTTTTTSTVQSLINNSLSGSGSLTSGDVHASSVIANLTKALADPSLTSAQKSSINSAISSIKLGNYSSAVSSLNNISSTKVAVPATTAKVTDTSAKLTVSKATPTTGTAAISSKGSLTVVPATSSVSSGSSSADSLIKNSLSGSGSLTSGDVHASSVVSNLNKALSDPSLNTAQKANITSAISAISLGNYSAAVNALNGVSTAKVSAPTTTVVNKTSTPATATKNATVTTPAKTSVTPTTTVKSTGVIDTSPKLTVSKATETTGTAAISTKGELKVVSNTQSTANTGSLKVIASTETAQQKADVKAQYNAILSTGSKSVKEAENKTGSILSTTGTFINRVENQGNGEGRTPVTVVAVTPSATSAASAKKDYNEILSSGKSKAGEVTTKVEDVNTYIPTTAQVKATGVTTQAKNDADNKAAKDEQAQNKANKISAGLGYGSSVNAIELVGSRDANNSVVTISTPANTSATSKNAVKEQYTSLVSTGKTTTGAKTDVSVKVAQLDNTQSYTRGAAETAQEVKDYNNSVKDVVTSTFAKSQTSEALKANKTQQAVSAIIKTEDRQAAAQAGVDASILSDYKSQGKVQSILGGVYEATKDKAALDKQLTSANAYVAGGLDKIESAANSILPDSLKTTNFDGRAYIAGVVDSSLSPSPVISSTYKIATSLSDKAREYTKNSDNPVIQTIEKVRSTIDTGINSVVDPIKATISNTKVGSVSVGEVVSAGKYVDTSIKSGVTDFVVDEYKDARTNPVSYAGKTAAIYATGAVFGAAIEGSTLLAEGAIESTLASKVVSGSASKILTTVAKSSPKIASTLDVVGGGAKIAATKAPTIAAAGYFTADMTKSAQKELGTAYDEGGLSGAVKATLGMSSSMIIGGAGMVSGSKAVSKVVQSDIASVVGSKATSIPGSIAKTVSDSTKGATRDIYGSLIKEPAQSNVPDVSNVYKKSPVEYKEATDVYGKPLTSTPKGEYSKSNNLPGITIEESADGLVLKEYQQVTTTATKDSIYNTPKPSKSTTAMDVGQYKGVEDVEGSFTKTINQELISGEQINKPAPIFTKDGLTSSTNIVKSPKGGDYLTVIKDEENPLVLKKAPSDELLQATASQARANIAKNVAKNGGKTDVLKIMVDEAQNKGVPYPDEVAIKTTTITTNARAEAIGGNKTVVKSTTEPITIDLSKDLKGTKEYVEPEPVKESTINTVEQKNGGVVVINSEGKNIPTISIEGIDYESGKLLARTAPKEVVKPDIYGKEDTFGKFTGTVQQDKLGTGYKYDTSNAGKVITKDAQGNLVMSDGIKTTPNNTGNQLVAVNDSNGEVLLQLKKFATKEELSKSSQDAYQAIQKNIAKNGTKAKTPYNRPTATEGIKEPTISTKQGTEGSIYGADKIFEEPSNTDAQGLFKNTHQDELFGNELVKNEQQSPMFVRDEKGNISIGTSTPVKTTEVSQGGMSLKVMKDDEGAKLVLKNEATNAQIEAARRIVDVNRNKNKPTISEKATSVVNNAINKKNVVEVEPKVRLSDNDLRLESDIHPSLTATLKIEDSQIVQAKTNIKSEVLSGVKGIKQAIKGKKSPTTEFDSSVLLQKSKYDGETGATQSIYEDILSGESANNSNKYGSVLEIYKDEEGKSLVQKRYATKEQISESQASGAEYRANARAKGKLSNLDIQPLENLKESAPVDMPNAVSGISDTGDIVYIDFNAVRNQPKPAKMIDGVELKGSESGIPSLVNSTVESKGDITLNYPSPYGDNVSLVNPKFRQAVPEKPTYKLAGQVDSVTPYKPTIELGKNQNVDLVLTLDDIRGNPSVTETGVSRVTSGETKIERKPVLGDNESVVDQKFAKPTKPAVPEKIPLSGNVTPYEQFKPTKLDSTGLGNVKLDYDNATGKLTITEVPSKVDATKASAIDLAKNGATKENYNSPVSTILQKMGIDSSKVMNKIDIPNGSTIEEVAHEIGLIVTKGSKNQEASAEVFKTNFIDSYNVEYGTKVPSRNMYNPMLERVTKPDEFPSGYTSITKDNVTATISKDYSTTKEDITLTNKNYGKKVTSDLAIKKEPTTPVLNIESISGNKLVVSEKTGDVSGKLGSAFGENESLVNQKYKPGEVKTGKRIKTIDDIHKPTQLAPDETFSNGLIVKNKQPELKAVEPKVEPAKNKPTMIDSAVNKDVIVHKDSFMSDPIVIKALDDKRVAIEKGDLKTAQEISEDLYVRRQDPRGSGISYSRESNLDTPSYKPSYEIDEVSQKLVHDYKKAVKNGDMKEAESIKEDFEKRNQGKDYANLQAVSESGKTGVNDRIKSAMVDGGYVGDVDKVNFAAEFGGSVAALSRIKEAMTEGGYTRDINKVDFSTSNGKETDKIKAAMIAGGYTGDINKVDLSSEFGGKSSSLDRIKSAMVEGGYTGDVNSVYKDSRKTVPFISSGNGGFPTGKPTQGAGNITPTKQNGRTRTLPIPPVITSPFDPRKQKSTDNNKQGQDSTGNTKINTKPPQDTVPSPKPQINVNTPPITPPVNVIIPSKTPPITPPVYKPTDNTNQTPSNVDIPTIKPTDTPIITPVITPIITPKDDPDTITPTPIVPETVVPTPVIPTPNTPSTDVVYPVDQITPEKIDFARPPINQKMKGKYDDRKNNATPWLRQKVDALISTTHVAGYAETMGKASTTGGKVKKVISPKVQSSDFKTQMITAIQNKAQSDAAVKSRSIQPTEQKNTPQKSTSQAPVTRSNPQSVMSSQKPSLSSMVTQRPNVPSARQPQQVPQQRPAQQKQPNVMTRQQPSFGSPKQNPFDATVSQKPNTVQKQMPSMVSQPKTTGMLGSKGSNNGNPFVSSGKGKKLPF